MSTIETSCKCGNITASAGNVEAFTIRCWQCERRTVMFDANQRDGGFYVAYDEDVEGGPLRIGETVWAQCEFDADVLLVCVVVRRDDERGKAWMRYDDAWAAKFYADPENRTSAEIDLPDDEVRAMWEEAQQGESVQVVDHPTWRLDDGRLYRTALASPGFQLIEIADEWCHEHTRVVGGLFWYLYRPLCAFREWRYQRGA